jgi:hypothetical protein
MKALNIIKYIFAIIGLGMLTGAFFMYKNTSKFLETAVITKGTVVELVESRSDNSSNNSVMYAPVVNFIDKKGVEVKVYSSTSSNPPSYFVGEKVEVLYTPEAPQNAKIKGFFSVWGGATILGIFGFILFAIGGAIFVFDKKKSNIISYLKQNGTRIESDFQSVGLNTSLAVNGRNPYTIVSQWQNPATSKLHIFTSDDIWFDPTDFIKTDKIKVLIDRNDPKKYQVDLSFLPEVER